VNIEYRIRFEKNGLCIQPEVVDPGAHNPPKSARSLLVQLGASHSETLLASRAAKVGGEGDHPIGPGGEGDHPIGPGGITEP
jgi:hypothetical protein